MNCNILDFGAVADGVTLNTSAIQAAIDRCAESGGGRVTVPTGIFKTGTIWLRSKVELHLEIGSELLAPVMYTVFALRIASTELLNTSLSRFSSM